MTPDGDARDELRHGETADRTGRPEGMPEREPGHLLPVEREHDPGRLLASHDVAASGKLLPAHTPDEREPDHGGWYPPHHPAHHARHTAVWLGVLLGLVGLFAIGMAVHDRVQERQHVAARAHRMTGGDPDQGRRLLRSYGCAQCHTIPGVAGANALVGPPLAGIASRVYVGGVVTNTPDHLVRWIMDPKAIDPMTAMPYLGVPEDQARHMAAYLYTLR